MRGEELLSCMFDGGLIDSIIILGLCASMLRIANLSSVCMGILSELLGSGRRMLVAGGSELG